MKKAYVNILLTLAVFTSTFLMAEEPKKSSDIEVMTPPVEDILKILKVRHWAFAAKAKTARLNVQLSQFTRDENDKWNEKQLAGAMELAAGPDHTFKIRIYLTETYLKLFMGNWAREVDIKDNELDFNSWPRTSLNEKSLLVLNQREIVLGFRVKNNANIIARDMKNWKSYLSLKLIPEAPNQKIHQD